MKSIFSLLLYLCLTQYTFAASDIMDVFRHAYLYDPQYQQTISQTLSTQENVGISLASLLPKINFSIRPTEVNSQNSGTITRTLLPKNNIIRSNEMRVSLSQTIFNYAKFASLGSANAYAKQASASLNAAFQNLIIRVAQAYFNILQDEENLRYCNANKAALGRQYYQIMEKYKAKSVSKADFYNAKSAYYSASSTCASNKAQLEIDREFLRTITNKSYPDLARLGEDFPLITPQPDDSEAWVTKAKEQNWTIKANEYALQGAKEQIKQQLAGHFPTVELEQFYDVTAQKSEKGAGLVSAGSSKMRENAISLDINVPIFSGGEVVSEVNQAKYNYQAAAQQLEQSIRNAVYNTRQSYLTIISDIEKIRNDKIAIKAAMISLEAMDERYHSGLGTLYDVLNQRQKVFQSQLQYSSDRYSYIMNLLSLKNSAGTLDLNDLQIINLWLSKA